MQQREIMCYITGTSIGTTQPGLLNQYNWVTSMADRAILTASEVALKAATDAYNEIKSVATARISD
jgi:hypothetical protein